MATRLNITVEDDVPALLEQLAGGRNKMGQYVTDLVRATAEGERTATEASDLEAMRYQMATVIGKQREVEARLLQMERQLAAIMAEK